MIKINTDYYIGGMCEYHTRIVRSNGHYIVYLIQDTKPLSTRIVLSDYICTSDALVKCKSDVEKLLQQGTEYCKVRIDMAIKDEGSESIWI